ncbi:hypothetical protein Tco_0388937 [Tanacetum coccineum]
MGGCGGDEGGSHGCLAVVMVVLADDDNEEMKMGMNEDISRNSIPRIKFNKWEELAEELKRWTAECGTQSLVRR